MCTEDVHILVEFYTRTKRDVARAKARRFRLHPRSTTNVATRHHNNIVKCLIRKNELGEMFSCYE